VDSILNIINSYVVGFCTFASLAFGVAKATPKVAKAKVGKSNMAKRAAKVAKRCRHGEKV
jgi:hypothetical protein